MNFDRAKYYCLNNLSKSLKWIGNLSNKVVGNASQLMPKTQNPIIMTAGKITSFISKIPGEIFCLIGSLLEQHA